MADAVETGEARRDELEAMLALMCAAFGLPLDAARDVFYADPWFDLANKRVLRVNGRLVSCLTIVEATCWIGNATVRLGGIAGVATLPNQQQRGYAGRLLTETVQTLRTRGVALSALFPFSYDYYRRFGWELAGSAYRYLTAPANLPTYPEAAQVRLAYVDDVPYLRAIYDATAAGRALHCLRDEKRWRYILEQSRQRVVFAPSSGNAEGYLLYDYRPNASSSGEETVAGSVPPATLRILEMRALSSRARRGLIGHLAGQQHVGCIEYLASWDELETCGLLDLMSPTARSGEALASIEPTPAVMTRVVHWPHLIEALSQNWSAWSFSGRIQLSLQDDLAGQTSSVVVSGDGSRPPQVENGDNETLPDRIEGGVRAWSQVVVGHRSADDACALGLLTASTPRARDLASLCFPTRAPFLPAPDHF